MHRILLLLLLLIATALALLSACGSRTYLETGTGAPDAAASGGQPTPKKCVPGAAPAVLVSKAGEFVIDGSGQLFVDHVVGGLHGVSRVSTTDDSVGAPLFLDTDGHSTLALDSTHLYWSYIDAKGGFGLRRVARDGGRAETLTTLPDFARGLAVDEHDLYFGLIAPASPRGLMRIPKTGGPPVVIVDAHQGFDVLAMSATRIYANDPGWLWSFDKITLASKRNLLFAPNAAVVDGETVFASGGADDVSGQSPTGKVFILPDGLTPAVALADRQASPTQLAFDDAFVYWVNIGTLTHDDAGTRPDNNGAIVKVPKSGGSPQTVVQTGGAGSPIAVDDECVYWWADGAIMKVHK